MWYIDALRLVRLCIKYNVLNTFEDGVLLYLNESDETPEGWHLFSKEDVAHQLMEDVEGVQALTEALANLGVAFEPQHSPRCH